MEKIQDKVIENIIFNANNECEDFLMELYMQVRYLPKEFGIEFFKQKIYTVNKTLSILSRPFTEIEPLPNINELFNEIDFKKYVKHIISEIGYKQNELEDIWIIKEISIGNDYFENKKNDKRPNSFKVYKSFVTINEIDENRYLECIEDTISFLGLFMFYYKLIAGYKDVSSGGVFENPKKPHQLQTKLTDTQRGKLFDLLVLHRFIPDKDKEGFIWAFGGVNDNYTSYSTEWLEPQAKNLAVYLVDKLCINYESTWVIGERIFSNVKGMRQMKDRYQSNGKPKTPAYQKPKGYELIDTIISEAQK
jgi:hypothetical protein